MTKGLRAALRRKMSTRAIKSAFRPAILNSIYSATHIFVKKSPRPTNEDFRHLQAFVSKLILYIIFILHKPHDPSVENHCFRLQKTVVSAIIGVILMMSQAAQTHLAGRVFEISVLVTLIDVQYHTLKPQRLMFFN